MQRLVRHTNYSDRGLRKSEKEGLSWSVVQRVAELRKIESHLKKRGNDKKTQLPNVQAVLAAYRQQSLEWTGHVTYWSKGKQLCQPRPFDWNEFDAINAAYKGHEGFWVEGVCCHDFFGMFFEASFN